MTGIYDRNFSLPVQTHARSKSPLTKNLQAFWLEGFCDPAGIGSALQNPQPMPALLFESQWE